MIKVFCHKISRNSKEILTCKLHLILRQYRGFSENMSNRSSSKQHGMHRVKRQQPSSSNATKRNKAKTRVGQIARQTTLQAALHGVVEKKASTSAKATADKPIKKAAAAVKTTTKKAAKKVEKTEKKVATPKKKPAVKKASTDKPVKKKAE